MKIALIGCVKKKNGYPCKAKDMYISPLFKGCYRLAKKENVDKIFILSAKYGLVEENTVIKPYNETLNSKKESEKKIWAYHILTSLIKNGCDIQEDKFIILAGENYRKYIIKKLKYYTIPLRGMSLYKMISYLSKI